MCLLNAQYEGRGQVSIFTLCLVKYMLETQALNFAVMAARDTRAEVN